MKKLLSILLCLIFVLTLGACGNRGDENEFYFIARVIELKEETMLIEVTDKGNCGVGVGNQITVSTEKISGAIADDSTAVTDNYLYIEFDGTIMETYPLQLGEIYRIDITNEKGESIE